MEIVNSYKLWLQSKSYSDATIRNYLVDLRKYFSFTNPDSDQITDKIFNQDNLSSYFQNINQDQNYKRFLASLSKFFQFALDQKLISENPFEKIRSSTDVLQYVPAIDDIIDQYQQYLTKNSSKGVLQYAPNTIRNYINDIHQYINWIKSTPIQNPPAPMNIGAPSFEKGWLSKIKLKFPLLQGGMSRRDKGVSVEN
jgi:hypothetical protein